MFGRKKKNKTTDNMGVPLPKKTSPSVVSSDMNVLGHVISDGHIDINGRVEGNVKCRSVTLRENGIVVGDVIADTVQIYGEVEGLVKASDVSLFETARVTGTIMHESLSIEDGAFVDGKFKRTDRVFIDDDPTGFIVMEDDAIEEIEEIEETADGNGTDDENVLDNLRLISG